MKGLPMVVTWVGACWNKTMTPGLSEHSSDSQPTTMVDSLQCIDNVNTKPPWSHPKGPLHLRWQTGARSVSFDLVLSEIAWRREAFSRRLGKQISGKATSLSSWLGLNHLYYK